MTTLRVTFPVRNAPGFVEEVKARVAEHFAAKGVSDKGGWLMPAKTILLFGLLFGLFTLLLTRPLPAIVVVPASIAMGVLLAGIGFGVAHDALHGAYSESNATNKFAGLSFDVVGANSYMWRITHNVIHHTYTNIEGVDEDLAVSPLIRLSPTAPYHRYHRFQHWYAWALYSLSTLFWVFVKDYKYFFQRDLGPYENRKHSRSEWTRLWVFKALHYGWSIALPLSVGFIGLWEFLGAFLLVHLTAGLILGVVFQLAHVVEETAYPTPAANLAMPDDWMVHEVITTSNFARKNRMLGWYVGGLNFQVEHHLFPRVCSRHYPAIAPLVEEVVEGHGLPYNQHTTFGEALGSHFRMLRRFSQPPATPAELAPSA